MLISLTTKQNFYCIPVIVHKKEGQQQQQQQRCCASMDSHLGNRVTTTAAAKRKRKRNKNKPAIEKVDNHRTNSSPKQEEAKRSNRNNNNNKKEEGHAHRANRRRGREWRWKRIASEVRVLQVMAVLILAVMLYFLARTFTAHEDRETFAMMRPITEKAIIVKEKATMVLAPLKHTA